MRCPSCGYGESKVVDSRPADDGASIRRRRECLECGNRFTTYERLGDNPLVIIKSDNSSEAFSRDKLVPRYSHRHALNVRSRQNRFLTSSTTSNVSCARTRAMRSPQKSSAI